MLARTGISGSVRQCLCVRDAYSDAVGHPPGADLRRLLYCRPIACHCVITIITLRCSTQRVSSYAFWIRCEIFKCDRALTQVQLTEIVA
jgi:hypothetical protein